MGAEEHRMELFHVHTYRCRHAGAEPDEAYVQKAIEMGASRIIFTDHAPFPADPFGNRMDYAQLSEYLSSLETLRKKYADVIEVKIGLEVEYLPKYQDYYAYLSKSGKFDVLMLGQHFFQWKDTYSFSMDDHFLDAQEYVGIQRALLEGMKSGWFQVVAHPDRMFQRCRKWTVEMEDLSRELIHNALEQDMVLERNLSSMHKEYQYWKEFWNLVPNTARTIIGLDAHATATLDYMYEASLCVPKVKITG